MMQKLPASNNQEFMEFSQRLPDLLTLPTLSAEPSVAHNHEPATSSLGPSAHDAIDTFHNAHDIQGPSRSTRALQAPKARPRRPSRPPPITPMRAPISKKCPPFYKLDPALLEECTQEWSATHTMPPTSERSRYNNANYHRKQAIWRMYQEKLAAPALDE